MRLSCDTSEYRGGGPPTAFMGVMGSADEGNAPPAPAEPNGEIEEELEEGVVSLERPKNALIVFLKPFLPLFTFSESTLMRRSMNGMMAWRTRSAT